MRSKLFIVFYLIVGVLRSQDWTINQNLTGGDLAGGDEFGASVSIDGDYAIIGSPKDDDNGSASGSAYIFRYTENVWAQQTKLQPSDYDDHEYFGHSVSIRGDYAIVGKYGGGSHKGSAYIFHNDGTSWSQLSKLTASDGISGDFFGYSVSIDGDYAIIGSYGDEDSGQNSGSAYIFYNDGNSWSQQAKIIANDADWEDHFGWSVSIGGEYAIVGAFAENSYEGSAYIFKRDGTSWTQQAKLTSEDDYQKHFGKSVSIDGDLAVIGAPHDNENGQYSGSVYIFTRSGSSWSQQDKLLPNDGYTSDDFGNAVSINRNTLVVGAQGKNNQKGSAYVFQFQNGTWIQNLKLDDINGEINDFYGCSVALSENNILIGARGVGEGTIDGNGSGDTYLYKKRETTLHISTNGSDANDGSEENPFATIQHGIDASSDGDTVLVHPGTYTENINYNGKNIVVGSLFLTTQDTSYISTTIIDGNQNGSVVTFENGETSSARLVGLTIQSGSGVSISGPTYGGGIYISSSSPTLTNLRILNNSATRGGGIYAKYSSLVLTKSLIKGNTAVDYGGGVHCMFGGSPIIQNCIIVNNRHTGTSWNGAGLCFFYNVNADVINCTIFDNHNDITSYSAGINAISNDVIVNVTNTIIWNNTYANNATSDPVKGYDYAVINLTNCDIEGGYTGTGNIDTDPLFVDAANGDYSLTNYSPAIGAGTATGAPTTDIDGNIRPNPSGSNPDMGAYENAQASQRPKAGAIADGLGTDIDWTNSTSSLSANWDAFVDNSTVTYEFSIGSDSTTISDILSWTSVGSDTFYTASGLSLTEGSTYYVSVRGTDIHGQVSDTTTTDGVTIDVTLPVISEVLEGAVPAPTTVTDIDGNMYDIVTIGTQVWMAENLKVTHYRDGTAIPTGHSNYEWWHLSPTGAYAVYDNNESNADTYGYLYNWYAVDDSRNIAPEGWHVPTDDEIKQLEMHLGMSQSEADGEGWRGTNEGSKLAGNADLWSDGTLENNSEFGTSGFTALPGGARYNDGIYRNMGNYGYFWSSTENNSSIAWYRRLSYGNSDVNRFSFSKLSGWSVRCVRDLDYSTISDADFQNESSSLAIGWSASADASGIANYEYALGTTSGGTETIAWTSTGTATGDTLTGLSLTEGQIYYLSVRVTDGAGNLSAVVTGDGITIDLTAPAGTTVNDGTGDDIAYTGSDTTLSANWLAFTEDLSGIDNYEYAIGTSSGGTDVVGWTDNATDTSFTRTGLSLSSGTTYYVSVRATDVAGNVSTTVTSDGVIVDTASPVAGSVIDGTDTDIDWTNSTSTLTATWSGFSDALSGIQKYDYAIGSSSGGTDVVSWTDNSTDTTVTRTDLTLANGTTYYINIRATDNVGNVSTVVSSDGITIDTDSPVISEVIEGGLLIDSTVVTDIDGNVYQTVQIGDQVWMAENLKVEHYREGTAIPTGHSNSEWSNLSTGAYAVYGGNASNADTYGYLYNWYAVGDSRNIAPEGWHVPTDDEIKQLEMFLGMSQSDADGTEWRGTDEGGKLKEEGTAHWNSPNTGATNESGFTALPGGYRDYSGSYYDVGSNGYFWSSTENASYHAWDRKLYYFNSVVSRSYYDKPGGFSVRCLRDSTIGQFDYSDKDFQNDANELIISWSGSDAASGIAQYEYALGTDSADSNTISWTNAGTTTADTLTGLSLIEGTTYYASARATDVAENLSAVVSGDGITIDLTAPAGTTVNDGTGDDIAYTGSDSTLSANWLAFTEDLSGIDNYEYAIGSTSGGTDVVGWTDNATDTSFTRTGLSLSSGTTYYVSVRATDVAGNVSTVVTSDGVIVDTASPVAGSVIDGTDTDIDWTNSTSTLTATWSGFSDALSGIQKYEYAIGTSSGGTDVVSWTDNSTDTTVTRTDLTLANGTTYYISIRATDNVGNVSTVVSSDGITIDTDSPVISEVIEGIGAPITTVTDIDGNVYQIVEIGDQVWMAENLKVSHYRNGDPIPTGLSDSQWSSTTAGAYAVYDNNESNADTYGYLYNWYAINDSRNIAPEGWHVPTDDEIKQLEMFLGMSQSDADGTGWRGTNEGSKLAGNADLWSDGNLENNAEFGTSGFTALPGGYRNTNGNYYDMGYTCSFWSSTEGNSSTAWRRELYYGNSGVYRSNYDKHYGFSIRVVRDLDYSTISDADFQNESSSLAIHWSASADSSGIANYEYALGTSSGGTETIDWTSTGTATGDTLTNLSLIEGTTYYLSVRVTDGAGNLSDVMTGDGITIDLTAPAGTTVNDGTSDDIAYTGSSTELSANWDAFTETVSGIEKYEYAIGSSSGGTDIVDWTSNSTNTSVTKTGLTLTSGTYYTSVKAKDVAGNVSNVITSNGVILDIDGPSTGTIADGTDTDTDTDWTNSTTTLSANWSGFNDALSGIQNYEYSIGTSSGGTDIVDWTDNSTETSVTKAGLTLSNGATYYASVRSTDNVGNVSAIISTNGITVDTDAPVISEVLEGIGAPTTVTDIDGNVYDIVVIGDQVWMAGNLKVTKYRDGSSISNITDGISWSSTNSGAYAVYDNNESNATTYGYLYNWYAVDDSRNIAPEGWHVPTDDEWKTLEMHLGMSQGEADGTGSRGTDEGSKLAGNADLWWDGNLENNSEFGTSGFTALPGGYRFSNGGYSTVGNFGYFWSSTEYDSGYAWYRTLYYDYSGVYRDDYYYYKQSGFSVRCVRDSTIGQFDYSDADFQNESSSLAIHWSASADLSGLANYEYALGTTSGGTETIDWTSTATATGDTLTNLSLIEGTTYYLSVRVTDGAGNVSDVMTGDGITIDMTAPLVGTVIDGTGEDVTYTGSDSTLTAEWSGFSDAISGIEGYETAIGTSSGGTEVMDWSWVGNLSSWTKTGLSLEHATLYYISVRAKDVAGNMSMHTTTNGVLVDTHPPGSVVDISADYYNAESWGADVQIHGTAADDYAGLTSMDVSVKNTITNQYWNGASWVSDEQWVAANGTDTWTYDLSSEHLTDGGHYSVRSRGTDAVGNSETAYGMDSFVFDTSAPNTELTISEAYYSANGWNSSQPIHGTAVDASSPVTTVTVRIIRQSDQLNWSGTNWIADTTWLLCEGTTEWHYDLSSDRFTDAVPYTIDVRAVDAAGNVETTYATDSFIFDTSTTSESPASVPKEYS